MNKPCIKCNEIKELSEFYPHKQMKDGHLNMCKECSKKATTEHRIKNIDYYRAYDNDRSKNKDRIYRVSLNTKRRRESKEGYMKAHNAVARAIKSGILIRGACQMCGETKNIHAHHDDYDTPLNVMWLCPVHHKSRHAFLDFIEQINEEKLAA